MTANKVGKPFQVNCNIILMYFVGIYLIPQTYTYFTGYVQSYIILKSAVELSIFTGNLDLDVGAVLLQPGLSPDLNSSLLFDGSIIQFDLVGVESSSHNLTRHGDNFKYPSKRVPNILG